MNEPDTVLEMTEEEKVEELAQKDYQQLLDQQTASKRSQLVHNRFLELVEAGIAKSEIPARQTHADVVNSLADNQLQGMLKAFFDSRAKEIANYNYVEIIENELLL